MNFYRFLFIALIFMLVLQSANVVYAQEITVYRSSFSVDSTITKINSSINTNGYKYLKMETFEAMPDSTSKFSGSVKIIYFETPEIYQLAACEPTAMMDMPLKIIVWNEEDDTYFGFMNANTYKKRFMIIDCDLLLRKINKILIRVANDVIRTK